MEAILDAVGGMPEWLGTLALLGAALVEYVFPPFPGDAVCLFGAFLVGHAGWSLPVVFVAVMAGNLLGLSADFAFGRWMRRRTDRSGAPPDSYAARLVALEPRFARHAAWTLLVNRFLPGIRAFLFVGAGYYRVPYRRVVLYGFLSALAWNGLIFAAGVAVGMNWGELSIWMSRYTTAVWILLGVVAAVFAGRWVWRKRTGSL
jgi:membrane-associated protein